MSVKYLLNNRRKWLRSRNPNSLEGKSSRLQTSHQGTDVVRFRGRNAIRLEVLLPCLAGC